VGDANGERQCRQRKQRHARADSQIGVFHSFLPMENRLPDRAGSMHSGQLDYL
jgi:hypothetical protein